MNKIDKDVYIDVDGTLTRELMVATKSDDKLVELRVGLVEFLTFLTDNFINVYWLSCNRNFCKNYLVSIGENKLNKKIKLINFRGGSKYDYLDYSRGFYFFDDEIEFDYYYKYNLIPILQIPKWKKEPYISKYNKDIHTMYYIPCDAPINILFEVIEEIKIREYIK